MNAKEIFSEKNLFLALVGTTAALAVSQTSASMKKNAGLVAAAGALALPAADYFASKSKSEQA